MNNNVVWINAVLLLRNIDLFSILHCLLTDSILPSGVMWMPNVSSSSYSTPHMYLIVFGGLNYIILKKIYINWQLNIINVFLKLQFNVEDQFKASYLLLFASCQPNHKLFWDRIILCNFRWQFGWDCHDTGLWNFGVCKSEVNWKQHCFLTLTEKIWQNLSSIHKLSCCCSFHSCRFLTNMTIKLDCLHKNCCNNQPKTMLQSYFTICCLF